MSNYPNFVSVIILSSKTSDRKDHFLNDLKRRILTLDLAPGSPLDEVALSQEYNVSRTPARDVFRQLAGEGYLLIRSNRGAQVSPMNHKTLRDFFLTAPMIYSATSRLAAINATDEQVLQLEGIQQQFMVALKNAQADLMVFYNDAFHSQIGEMADNVYLTPSLRRLLIDHARIGHTFYRPVDEDSQLDMDTAANHHNEMIEAFRDNDEHRSARLAAEHWELSRKSIERFITPESLDIPLQMT